MASKDGTLPVDQDRIVEAEPTGAVGNLLDLLLRMRPCIARPWSQVSRWQHLDRAHGHFLNIWHRPTNADGGFTCRVQDLAQPWSQQSREQDRLMVQENEANRFAIEPLAPRSLVRPFLKGIPDLAHAANIARRLNLSREASARRYIELREEPLALVFSKTGLVRYIDQHDAFPFLKLQMGDALPSLPFLPDETTVTNHEAADRRDWGMRPGRPELVVQTLHQEGGCTMTLLALDQQDTETDEDN